MRARSNASRRGGCVIFALLAGAAVLGAQPVTAQYNDFPGGAATNDSRTVALAGDSIQTLSQDSLTFILAVPYGVTQFELGVFDGETGRADGSGARHWDNGSTQLQYALYYDPYQQGSTDPANLVGVWRGNETNPVADPGGAWTASSATFPDNGWWNLTVDVPEPPEPLPGMAPSGATYYHLCVSYRAETGSVIDDPCTGDPRPVDPSPSTIANFKLRTTTNISVLSFAFAYEAALRIAGNADLATVYPLWDGSVPPLGSTFWLTTPTTYDGTWSFDIDVPMSVQRLRLFGGDFDFGTNAASTQTFPSQQPLPQCVDTDDPDTPNDAFFPPFAVMGSTRLDDSLPEGARAAGSPADDNTSDIFRRSPCVRWTLTSPNGTVYANDNPSSQREWEQFLIDTSPTCDDSPTCDPSLSDCADYCESGLLPAGIWRVDLEGVDLSNLNAWRSDNLTGFCLGCQNLPRPYLIGDTVFADGDQNGNQDAGEPGIPGVVVELIDPNGNVMDTRVTGDPSGYGPGGWAACQERNTGTGTPIDDAGLYCFDVSVPNDDPSAIDQIDYTVRIAASNFAPGGALYEYFGAEPEASRPSPEQTGTVVEDGGNVMTYDFGYFVQATECGPCEGKVTRLTLRYDGDHPAYVKVKAKKGSKQEVVFAGTLSPGDTFEVVGPDDWRHGFNGTLGTEIKIYVDGSFHTSIHTSCSQPIGPGLVRGDFEVVSGESRDGGALCPLDGSCDGGGHDGGGDSSVGTGTLGYWKNHPEAWPVDEIDLGPYTLSKMQGLYLLSSPPRGNKVILLAQQLLATKLNLEAGSEASCIEDVVDAADQFLSDHPPSSHLSRWDARQAEELASTLDDYNNGKLCAPHRD